MSSTQLLSGDAANDAGKVVALAITPQNVALARSKEKKNLQHLNEKLSEYIGDTTALSLENKRLRQDLESLNAIFATLDERLRKQYENEIKLLRESLDKALVEKAAAVKKVSHLESDLKKSEDSLALESLNHEKTKKEMSPLKKMIAERDGQIDFLTKNLKSSQEEVKISKKKITELQLELACSKRGTEVAAVQQIQFDAKIQTKDDEIEFLKNIYEEQVELLSQIEISNNTICCPEHLVESLRDIRADYEALIRARESADPDAWYKSKFDQVMKIGEQKQEALAAEKKKVDEWRKKYEKARDDCDVLEKIADGEKKKWERAEETLSGAIEEHAITVREKDESIESLKAEFAHLFEILRRLTDPNLSVTGELNEAKKLLEAGGAAAKTA